MTDNEIGQRIQQRRMRLGWSQEQFGAALAASGLSWAQGTMSKIERGERSVRLTEAPTVAAVLGMSVAELADGPADVITEVLTRIDLACQEAQNEARRAEQQAAKLSAALSFWSELAAAAKGNDVQVADPVTAFQGGWGAFVQRQDLAAIVEQLGGDETVVRAVTVPPARGADGRAFIAGGEWFGEQFVAAVSALVPGFSAAGTR